MQPSISAAVSLLFLCAGVGSGYLYKTIANTSDGYCENEKFGQITVGQKGYNYEACELIFCLRGVYYRQGCGEKPLNGHPECRRVARPGMYPTCCFKRIECEDEEQEIDPF